MKQKAAKLPQKAKPKVFLAQLGDLAKKRSLKLTEEFRKAKVPIIESIGKDSLRAQMKIADRFGVDYTLILGQKEALSGNIILRHMSTGKQKSIKLENIIEEIKKRSKK